MGYFVGMDNCWKIEDGFWKYSITWLIYIKVKNKYHVFLEIALNFFSHTVNRSLGDWFLWVLLKQNIEFRCMLCAVSNTSSF